MSFVVVALLALLALSIPSLLVALVVQWSRQRELRRRVDELERRFARLRPADAAVPRPSEPAIARGEARTAAQVVEHVLVAETAPLAPPEATTSPAAAAAPPTIHWERWFGVQGAAVLGGCFLALAGLLFVQYSIERGWLSPAVRCVLGAVAGIAALIVSSPLRRRSYRITSDALAGAGATLLFAATWAAYSLYELLPFWAAFAVLVATTAVCGALSLARGSRTIAWFGLLGGFATPLLLTFDASRPLGLFLYLLGLDVAVLTLGAKRGWSGFASAASIATHLVFGLWIVRAFDPNEAAPALLLCGALGAMFAVLGSRADRLRLETCLGATLPFVFALYFARTAHFGEHITPVATLLGVLNLGAIWIARSGREPRMLLVAGFGSAAAIATWTATAPQFGGWMWEVALVTLALAALGHAALEFERHSADVRALARRTSASSLPLALCVLFGAAHAQSSQLAPWLVATAGIVLLHLRAAHLGASTLSRALAALLPAATYVLWRMPGGGQLSEWPHTWIDAFANAALAATALGVAQFAREPFERRWASNAAVVASALLLAASSRLTRVDPAVVLTSALGLVAIGLVAARRGSPVAGFALLAGSAWFVDARWASASARLGGAGWLDVTAVFATAVTLSLAPVVSQHFRRHANVWRLAAVLPLAWSVPFAIALRSWRPDLSVGAPYAVLACAGAVFAGLTWQARIETDEHGRRSAPSSGFAWVGAATLFLAALAIALHMQRAEALIAFALLAGGCAWLARAARHAGVRALSSLASSIAFAAIFVRLFGVLAAPHRHFASGVPLFHELAYDFGVPTLMLFAAVAASRGAPEELDAPDWASHIRANGWIGLAALIALFVWLNVEVVNLCSAEHYAFELRRMPTRDIALSATWTLFSLALLLAGVRLERSALRWTSLAFFLTTIGKVFLYDLGELRGLHRVASLVGLALALLCVSLLYQRFVFRSSAAARVG